MLEPITAGTAAPRAFVPVGGLSLAAQQLGLLQGLGCERVICLARALGPELVELQHTAEKGGAQFHAVSAPRALVGLVTTADELVVLADGLLADPEEVRRLVGTGPGVLTQPAETGLPAGFERIDPDQASAGVLRVPGRLIERLADMPQDIDVVSAITRIALQAGVPQRKISTHADRAIQWALVRSEAEAHQLEPAWLEQRMIADTDTTPGTWLARKAAKRFGPALLHAGNGKAALVIAAGVLGLLGLGSAWFGLVSAGLSLIGLAWIASLVAQQLEMVERRALFQAMPRVAMSQMFDGLIDLGLIAAAGWGIGVATGMGWSQQFFAPAMVIGLSRLVPRWLRHRWGSWLGDRALLAGGLAVAQAAGQTQLACQLAALALVVVAVLQPRDPRS